MNAIYIIYKIMRFADERARESLSIYLILSLSLSLSLSIHNLLFSISSSWTGLTPLLKIQFFFKS